jgi:hypothetical protein
VRREPRSHGPQALQSRQYLFKIVQVAYAQDLRVSFTAGSTDGHLQQAQPERR